MADSIDFTTPELDQSAFFYERPVRQDEYNLPTRSLEARTGESDVVGEEVGPGDTVLDFDQTAYERAVDQATEATASALDALADDAEPKWATTISITVDGDAGQGMSGEFTFDEVRRAWQMDQTLGPLPAQAVEAAESANQAAIESNPPGEELEGGRRSTVRRRAALGGARGIQRGRR